MRKISNIIKKIFIILIILIIIIFISGFSASYNSLNIDNSAFAIAIGIDKSTSDKLSVNFEFLSTSPSGESVSETKPVLNSVECSSIINGINLMNAYLGRKVNLTHCKLIIFSEELAKEGISDEVYSLINDVQVRPSANIIVSKGDTKTYIENSIPSLENLIPKYYDIFPNTSKYTGYTCNATIGDFFNALVCNSCSPYAMLGGITKSEKNTSNNNNQTSQQNENSSQNGEKSSQQNGKSSKKDIETPDQNSTSLLTSEEKDIKSGDSPINRYKKN